MQTIHRITPEQLDCLVLRLMGKVKDIIMAGGDHRRMHAISLRATVEMVRANMALGRHGAGATPSRRD